MYQQQSKDGSGLDSDNSPACRYNGFKNQGYTSLNSVLQVLFFNKDFREAVQRHCSENPNSEHIDAQLNKVFDDLKKDPGDSYDVIRKLPAEVYNRQHAAWCLDTILNLTSPEASQMFYGQLRQRTTCGTCRHHTDEVNAFWNLPLNVMDTDTDFYSVMDGIKSLFRCIELKSQMYCDHCGVKVDATTQTGIIDHPEHLTLLLDRFEYDNRKQSDQICVYVPRTLQIEDQTYELHAVVEHHAGPTNGGYTTVKTQDDGRWYKFKDTRVDIVVDPQPFPAVMENPHSPHLLVYQKEKTHEPDTSFHEVNLKPSSEDCNEKKEASKQTTAKINYTPETNSSQTGATANSGDSPVTKYYGLERRAATCSLNAVLQILFMNKDFREAVGRVCNVNPKTKNTDAQLNKLFEDLKKDTADSYVVKSNLGGGVPAYIERDAAKYLERILNTTSPEASQMFRGQLRHRTTCCRCYHHVDEVNPFWNLPLVMGTNTEVYSVLNGIESFFKHSKLGGHNQMYCRQCGVTRDATTQTEIIDHPEILTLLLKRSEYEDFLYRFDQINHRVDAPLTLQIAENQTYELHAVVEHYGGVQSGGYTAIIKCQDDGRWYKFQDNRVTLVDSQPFQAFTEKSSSPHLLIYRNEKTHGSDTSVHEVNLKSSSEDRSSICRERNRNAPEDGNDNDGLDSTERHSGAKNKYTVDRAVSSVPYQEDRVPQRIGNHLSGQSGLCKSQDSQDRVSKRELVQDHGQREHETAGNHRQNLKYTDQKYSQKILQTCTRHENYVESSCLDVKGNRGMDKHLQTTEGWKKDGDDKKKDVSKQTTAKNNSPLEANSSETVPKYYGLNYQGGNCSLNSVLQVLFMNKDFRETVRRYCNENPNTKNVDAQLNKVFHALKKHNASSYDVKWKLGVKAFEGLYAAEYLEKILNMTSPEASQMFRGQLGHRTTCCGPTCRFQTEEVSPFWHLSLDMDINSEVYSVVDGIESLGRTKTSGHIHKDCHYGGKGDKTNQTGIKDHPEVLTLLLNRFEYDKRLYRYNQLNRLVDVPLNLQMAENQTYELHAVVDHHGGIPGCGSWTATIKSQDDGRWYKFADTRVTLMNPQPFQTLTERSRTAYLLMYKKAKKHIPDQDSGQRVHEKAGEDCQTLQHADQKSVARHEDSKVVRTDTFQDKLRSINMDVNRDKHSKEGGDDHVHTEWWAKREGGQEEESYGGGQAGMAGKGAWQKEHKELGDGGQERPHDSQKHGGVRGQEIPYDSQYHGGVKEQGRPYDSQYHGGVRGQEIPYDSQYHGGVKGDGGQERPHDSQKHGGVKEQGRPYDSPYHGGVKGDAGQERQYDSQYHGGVKGDGGQERQYDTNDSQYHRGVKGQGRQYDSQKHGGVKGQERQYDSQYHGGVKGDGVQQRQYDGQKHGGVKGQERPHDSQYHGEVKGDGGQERQYDTNDSQYHRGVKGQGRQYDSQKHGGEKGQERHYDSQYHGGVKGDGVQQRQYDGQKHGRVKGDGEQERSYDSQKRGRVKGQGRQYDSQKHGGQEIPNESQTHGVVKGAVQKAASDDTMYNSVGDRKKNVSWMSRIFPSFLSSPACKYNGLLNQGSTCYLNSVLQVLFMNKDFRKAVERHCRENPKTENIDAQLNALFEDLKTNQSYTYKITEKMEIKKVYVQRDAAEYLEKILNMTSPEASQMFRGQLRHRTTCRTHLHHTDVVNPFWNLHLSMDTDSKVYSVMDGIKQFFTPTHFSGDNQMYCDNCDAKEDATLESEINHYPEILTLLLKRFEFNVHLMDYIKINRLVDVPTMLKMSKKQTYELYGVVDHGGSMQGGHYTARIKSQDDDRWYCFNDSSVTELYPQPFQGSMEKSSSAYVLFYRKKKEDTPSLQGHEVSQESFSAHYYEKHDGNAREMERNEFGKITEEGDYRAGAVSTQNSVKKDTVEGHIMSCIGGIVESLSKLTTYDDHHKGQDSQEGCSHGRPKDRGQRAHQNREDDQKLQHDDHYNTGLKRDACKRTSKSLVEGSEERMASNSMQIKKEKRD